MAELKWIKHLQSPFPLVDSRINFYKTNEHLLPPKPRISLRHLKKGIQEFHSKFVLVPADKAANNIIIVWRLHYINVLQHELNSTKAYTSTPSTEQQLINDHITDISKLKVHIHDQQLKLPTMYWIPKLHKQPYKARFIANSSSCTTTNISKLLTSCLTAIKLHVKRYCDKVYENTGKHLFWSIKNSGDVLDKLKIKNYMVSSVSTYDFSTLYTTLPHNLITDKLNALIQKTFARENDTFLACTRGVQKLLILVSAVIIYCQ